MCTLSRSSYNEPIATGKKYDCSSNKSRGWREPDLQPQYQFALLLDAVFFIVFLTIFLWPTRCANLPKSAKRKQLQIAKYLPSTPDQALIWPICYTKWKWTVRNSLNITYMWKTYLSLAQCRWINELANELVFQENIQIFCIDQTDWRQK